MWVDDTVHRSFHIYRLLFAGAPLWSLAYILGDGCMKTLHYNDVIMSAMVSHITSLTIVYSGNQSGADQRKHPSSASGAFVRGIHRWPVNFPHKRPVTPKMFPFNDVIMHSVNLICYLVRLRPVTGRIPVTARPIQPDQTRHLRRGTAKISVGKSRIIQSIADVHDVIQILCLKIPKTTLCFTSI